MGAVVSFDEKMKTRVFATRDDISAVDREVTKLSDLVNECDERTRGLDVFVTDIYNKFRERLETVEARVGSGSGSDQLEDLSKKLYSISQRIEEHKSSEEITALNARLDNVHEALEEMRKELSNSKKESDDISESVEDPKMDSDLIFWTDAVHECYRLRKMKHKKDEIAPMLSAWSEYDNDAFWMKIVNMIFSRRKVVDTDNGAKMTMDDVASMLNDLYKIRVKARDDIDILVAKTNVSTEEGKTSSVHISSSDAFISALESGGLEIVDIIEKYVVKDAEGRTFEISRRALEKAVEH